jgi:hypothetical protein
MEEPQREEQQLTKLLAASASETAHWRTLQFQHNNSVKHIPWRDRRWCRCGNSCCAESATPHEKERVRTHDATRDSVASDTAHPDTPTKQSRSASVETAVRNEKRQTPGNGTCSMGVRKRSDVLWVQRQPLRDAKRVRARIGVERVGVLRKQLRGGKRTNRRAEILRTEARKRTRKGGGATIASRLNQQIREPKHDGNARRNSPHNAERRTRKDQRKNEGKVVGGRNRSPTAGDTQQMQQTTERTHTNSTKTRRHRRKIIPGTAEGRRSNVRPYI